MNWLINFFDYIYYRVYSFFIKRRDNIADVKATNLVTIIQGFIIIDFFMILKRIYPFEIPKEYFNKWLWGIPLAIIIGYLNYYRYGKKTNLSAFERKWANEDKKIKKVKGWLIVFLIFFLIFGVVILMIIM